MNTRAASASASALCLLSVSVCLSCARRGTVAGNGDHGAAPAITRTTSGIEMVRIPGGWFEMGSAGGTADETPVHRVWITALLMDRHEVSQEHYARFPLPDPSHFKNPKHPVEQMNWNDAATYCNERSRAEGLEPCYEEGTWACDFSANGYRLPTEAEWEYACRAGTTSDYSCGDDERRLGSHAWFAENSSGTTQPVGTKRANPWGLCDMHGNVAEWCQDFYAKDYYGSSPERDPKGPEKGSEKVLRGGAWNSTAASCRSSYRAGDAALDDTCLASDAIGFRCVRRAPPEE